MRKHLIIIAFIAFVASSIYIIHEHQNTTPIPASVSGSYRPKATLRDQRRNIVLPSLNEGASEGYQMALRNKCHLTESQVARVLRIVDFLGEELYDAKGAQAILLDSTESRIRIKTPGLKLSYTEIHQHVRDAIARVIGASTAEECLQIAEVVDHIDALCRTQTLGSDEEITITKAEASGSSVGSASVRYSAQVKYTTNTGESVDVHYTDFKLESYAGQRNVISWRALAKIPRAFFSGRQINGDELLIKRQWIDVSADLNSHRYIIYNYATCTESFESM